MVAIPPNHQRECLATMAEFELLPHSIGGKSRAETVALALKALPPNNPYDTILIHDAARGMVTSKVINNVLKALKQGAKAVVPAVAVADTLKHGKRNKVIKTVPRTDLFAAQTPQGFNLNALRKAVQPPFDYTDEAMAMERAGIMPVLVEGEPSNIKITHKQDWQLAQSIDYSQTETRTGNGYDVHRLLKGRQMILGGVKIAGAYGLEGHSDADVVLHALVDALLGALGLGDIGTHFPASDARWKDAPSKEFVKFAMEKLQSLNGNITNADITIICEEPKIAPLRAKMTKNIAQLLATLPARVNVKATTTEGLGFEGRREGISAMATVTITLPTTNSTNNNTINE